MPRLMRLHFASIGHRRARLSPLTLDFRDNNAGTGADTEGKSRVRLKDARTADERSASARAPADQSERGRVSAGAADAESKRGLRSRAGGFERGGSPGSVRRSERGGEAGPRRRGRRRRAERG